MVHDSHIARAFAVADVAAWVLMVYSLLGILVGALQILDPKGVPFNVPTIDLICALGFGVAAFLLYRRLATAGLVLLAIALAAGITLLSSLETKVLFVIAAVTLVLPWALQRIASDDDPVA